MKSLRLILTLLLAVSSFVQAESEAAGQKAFREVTWDDLMPEGWVPTIPEFSHDTFNYEEEPVDLVKLDQEQQKEIAPVVSALDKQKLRLPGYIIPIKMQEQSVTEFLLVPYMGACIHVPPPPENQMVYVTLKEPLEVAELWAPVWVSGVMTTQLAYTQYAIAGYHMKEAVTELYEY